MVQSWSRSHGRVVGQGGFAPAEVPTSAMMVVIDSRSTLHFKETPISFNNLCVSATRSPSHQNPGRPLGYLQHSHARPVPIRARFPLLASKFDSPDLSNFPSLEAEVTGSTLGQLPVKCMQGISRAPSEAEGPVVPRCPGRHDSALRWCSHASPIRDLAAQYLATTWLA
jgi:hypothetical protein